MHDRRVIAELPGPVQIVSITDDHKFVLDEEKLKKILFHPRVQDKRVRRTDRRSRHRHFSLRSPSFRSPVTFAKANRFS